MSDYLVNLARRSAGLAPMVRARVALPAAVADSAPEASSDGDSTRHASVSTHTDAAAPSHVRIAPVVLATATTSAAVPATPIVVGSLPAPAVQRFSALPRTTSVTAAQVIAAPLAQVTDVRPAPSPMVSSEVPEIDGHVARVTPPNAESAVTRLVERVIEPVATVIEPGPRVSVAPAGEDGGTVQPRETRPDTPSPIELKPTPVSVDVSTAVAVVIEPAPRAEATPPVIVLRNDAAQAPERTVHVRIGAIEIHSGESTQSSKAATSAPALAVAASQPSSPSGGFDDFTALRSYAPWTW